MLKGFALTRNGEPVWLPLAAQRLVAFLALQDHRVSRTFVAAQLWTDTPEERARAALRTTLWRVGQSAHGIVSAGDHTLALSRDVVLDVGAASVHARRVIEHPQGEDDEDMGLLIAGGELLPGWYDDWVLLERERFRQLRVRALEARCSALTAAGRLAEAADVGFAAVAAEPLRESSHRALIAVHLAEGNPGEALRQYESFRRLLASTLHLSPSRLMESLIEPARR